MHRYVVGGVLAVLMGLSATAAAQAFSVAVVVSHGGFGTPAHYVLAKLPSGSSTAVLQHPLPGPGNATLSRDRQRIYAISEQPDQTRLLEVLDADDFELLHVSVLQPPFDWSTGGTLAELPNQPGVLMASRCWWIDSQTGAMRETPTSLGIECGLGANSDGLSSSGRYLLLDDFDASTSTWRMLLVATAQPRTHLLVLPSRSGPILDDDSAVAVALDDRIELRPIVGTGPVQVLPPPPQVLNLSLIGAHRGALYGTALDPASSRQAIYRYRRDVGQWSAVVVPFDSEFLQHVDFHGRRASFTAPSIEICTVGCLFLASSRIVFDTDSGAVTRTDWSTGGVVSMGANLLNDVPTRPVVLFASPLSFWLLIGLVLVVAGRRLAGVAAA